MANCFSSFNFFILSLFSVFAIAAASAESSLLSEGKRQLAATKETLYQHKTDVDEDRGHFFYDCSGFISYAVKRVSPEAYSEIPISGRREKRPLAKDFYHLFVKVRSSPSKHWKEIPHAIDLKPGDIIAWLRPENHRSTHTGHVMIVLSEPSVNPALSNEILVKVIDSSHARHAQDSRSKGKTGLGTGTIGIFVDAEGRPLKYRWRGGISKRIEATSISFGRIVNASE